MFLCKNDHFDLDKTVAPQHYGFARTPATARVFAASEPNFPPEVNDQSSGAFAASRATCLCLQERVMFAHMIGRRTPFAFMAAPLVIAAFTATPAFAQSVTAGAQNSAGVWQLVGST